MFSICILLLSITVSKIFTQGYPMSNDENGSFIPPISRMSSVYPFSVPQLLMSRTRPQYPFPSEPVMQGFPFQNQMMPPMDPFNRQLNMLIQSELVKLRVLMAMRNSFASMNPYNDQLYPMPLIPMYDQQPQPQVDVQQKLKEEILQNQQNKADEQQQAMEDQNLQLENEYTENHQGLPTKLAYETDSRNERAARERKSIEDQKEIEDEQKEMERQILKEQEQERERVEREKKIREKAELRLKKIEEQKQKKNQNEKPKNSRMENQNKFRQRGSVKTENKPTITKEELSEDEINTLIPKKPLLKQKSNKF